MSNQFDIIILGYQKDLERVKQTQSKLPENARHKLDDSIRLLEESIAKTEAQRDQFIAEQAERDVKFQKDMADLFGDDEFLKGLF